MTAPDVATVQTLTADVRTLVLGTRQVTLSVARQLDWVTLERLRVFGRVRLGLSGPRGLAVIGAAQDGSLALAEYEDRFADERRIVEIYDDGLPGKVRACGSLPTRDGFVSMLLNGQPFTMEERGIEICEQAGYWYGKDRCDSWNRNGLRDLIRELISSDLPGSSGSTLDTAAMRSSLIVLAGLK